MIKFSTRDKGKLAEEIALNHLKSKGYFFIQSNFYIKGGEIDLIMQDKDFIVFVEVKSLNKQSNYSIYTTLTKFKKARLKKTIGRWLFENNKLETPWRCDFIGIIFDGESHQVEHFEFVDLGSK